MITDIKEFRKLIPTVTGSSLAKYETPIEEATLWLKTKILGTKLMDKIEAMKEGDFYNLAMRLVAYNAYLRSIPLMDVLETSNGFAVVNDDKMAPASSTRVENLAKGIKENLNEALERLIEYLEDTPDLHDAWEESPTFSIMYDSLIPTLRMFRRYGQFEGSYFEFINAVPAVRAIITEKIEPAISWEFMGELLDQVRKNTFKDDAHKLVIEKLRWALGAFYNRKQTTGERIVNQVREILIGEPDKYPAFKNSGLFAAITHKDEKSEKHKSIHVII